MTCNVLTGADDCVAQMAKDALSSLAETFATSAGWAIKNSTTIWLNTATPDVTGSESPAVWLADRMAGFIFAVAFLSVLWAAYRLATAGTFEHVSDLAWSLARLVVVAGAVGGATALALSVGDSVSAWVLAQSDVDLSKVGQITVGAALNSPLVVVVLASFVVVAQLVQAMLMLAKNAMVILLVGFLPLTAAATNTPVGQQGFYKALTWLGAFLLYKPVASVIYAVSFKMMSRDSSLAGQLSGVTLMVLAILALPALMRFLVPITAAASGGNAGAVAGAVVGAAVATGATIAAGVATGGAGFAGAGASAALPSGASIGGLSTAATGATDTTTENNSPDSEASV